MSRKVRWLYPFDYPVLLFALGTYSAAILYGFHINWKLFLDLRGEFLLMLLGAPFSVAAVWYWKRTQENLPPRVVWHGFKESAISHVRDWRVWYETLRIIIAIHACLMLFCILKQALPLIHPHLYDAQLEGLDQWFNFGFSPAVVGMRFSAHPLLTRSVDMLYVLWYFVKAPVLLIFLFHPDARRRWHFFTAYVLLWIAGWVAYALVPTLGPIYTHPKSFEGLDMPVARALQAELWKHYQLATTDPRGYFAVLFEGIAAFPSLHVGIVALFAVALRRYRIFFWPMVIYVVCMEVGSVLLGWHYALDGYTGIAMAVAIYYGTWILFRRRDSSPAMPEADTPENVMTRDMVQEQPCGKRISEMADGERGPGLL